MRPALERHDNERAGAVDNISHSALNEFHAHGPRYELFERFAISLVEILVFFKVIPKVDPRQFILIYPGGTYIPEDPQPVG